MAPPPLMSGCSKSATAALEHLRGVEKQLQYEGLVFDKGTVQHLEDAIKAIKELEEERKHIIELLEEETIKNCNLRIRVKGIPPMVMEEFEALVAAAHRSRFTKISEIEVSVQEILCAIEQTSLKQRFSEELNLALCKEQKEFGSKHEEAIGLLNQHMGEKHDVNIQINELQNKKEEEEEETAWQINVIEELEKTKANEVTVFMEQQGLLESQIAEVQSKLKAKKLAIAQKRMEYGILLATLQALEEQVVEKNQAIVTGKEELAKLFEKIKCLLKDYEKKKAEKQEILQKKAEVQNNVTGMDSHFNELKEALLQQLIEAEKQMESTRQSQKKLRNENLLLKAQYESMLEEEMHFSERRNDLATEFERLSNEVTEKLDRMTKRLVEIQSLEEEREKMKDLLETSEHTYLRAVESLELTLQIETERSKMLQEQLNEILEKYRRLHLNHEEFMRNMQEKIKASQKLYDELLEKNEAFRIEISRSEENIKTIYDQFTKKSALFTKFSARITVELKKLQDEYNTQLELLHEWEEKLSIKLPISEKLQMELQKKSAIFDEQVDLFTELEEEEITLTKSLKHSVKEIDRLRRLKGYLKSEIDKCRAATHEQLITFSESLKFLERDYYEINRKLYIVSAENARFREAIAHLRAEISAQDSEAEAYQSKRQEIQKEVRALQDLFDKRWSEDRHLWQLFLMRERQVLKALAEHVKRFKNRNANVTYVSHGLQLNYEELVSLIKSQPRVAREQESCSTTSAIAT